MNILSKIDKYKYISFDIFDTLVSRNVFNSFEKLEIILEELLLVLSSIKSPPFKC